MALESFTLRFPTEIEHEILYCLGQSDLTRTALVCRDFKDLSTPLLLRHIARWAVVIDEHGEPDYIQLFNSHTVLHRFSSEPQLAIHVRYLDIATTYLHHNFYTEELRTIWASIRNLVALRLQGPTPRDAELGLTDVRFPLLRRLHVDYPDACPSFIRRHLDMLTHLRIDNCLPWDGATTVHLTHYEGPIEPFLDHLCFASLEHCIVRDTISEDLAARALDALSLHRNLRVLVLDFDLSNAQLGAVFAQRPRFANVRDLLIVYGDEDAHNMSAPPLAVVLAPFPTARRVCVLDRGWEPDCQWEPGTTHAWADAAAQACRDVEVVAAVEGFLVPVAGSGWQIQDDSVWDMKQLSAPLVVPAVPY